MANQNIYQNGIQVYPVIDLLNAELGSDKKNKVLGTDENGKVVVSSTTVTPETLSKVSYLEGVTDNVQDQLDEKVKTVVKDTQNANNTIDNKSGQNGCIMQTLLSDKDTIISFNTASENGASGILGQVYAKSLASNNGMRINFTKSGAYYSVGSSTPTDTAHEIAVKGDFANKLDKNADITAATKCKITYDTKGLVTAGADLESDDIPVVPISKVDQLQTKLNEKQATLTFDTTPTASSTNPVTSGGIKNALDLKQTAAMVTAFQMIPDDVHYCSEKLVSEKLGGKVDIKEGMSLSKITLNGTVTDTPTIYAMGTAGSNGQIQRFNISTGKMEWFSIPTTIYIKEPKTGNEIKAITPGPSIEGEMRYCTADDTGSPVVYHAGNFYLCTMNDASTYGWFAMGSFVDLTAYQLKNLGTANKAVQTDASGNISVSSFALGAACAKGIATEISEYNQDLVTSRLIYEKVPTFVNRNTGSNVIPVHLANGVITSSSGTNVGASNQPIYMNAGALTAGISITSGTADPTGTPAGGVGSIYIKYTA